MKSFGRRIKECRETKKISQNELSKEVGVHLSIIGKYERDEVRPSIDVAKKIANALDTTVGYLLSEGKRDTSLENRDLIKRLNDILSLSKEDQEHIFYALDAMVKSAKIKSL